MIADFNTQSVTSAHHCSSRTVYTISNEVNLMFGRMLKSRQDNDVTKSSCWRSLRQSGE